MSVQYDDKGKFYTDVVTKIPLTVAIQTATHIVKGYVHLRQGDRLKNELEREEKFLAVTNAQVYTMDEKLLFTSPFIALHRSHIIWVAPEEGPKMKDGSQ